jgi:hypothetical protein
VTDQYPTAVPSIAAAETMLTEANITTINETINASLSVFTESLFPHLSAMQTIYNFSKISPVPENRTVTNAFFKEKKK